MGPEATATEAGEAGEITDELAAAAAAADDELLEDELPTKGGDGAVDADAELDAGESWSEDALPVGVPPRKGAYGIRIGPTYDDNGDPYVKPPPRPTACLERSFHGWYC